jgi:hypothetical protein
MGIKTRNCKHLETLLFLCTYHAFLLFIIYLYQQINNLETLFNAACLNLSIILVFNFKNCCISETGSMVLPFELEKFLLFELCVRAGVESSVRVVISPPEDGSRTHLKMLCSLY